MGYFVLAVLLLDVAAYTDVLSIQGCDTENRLDSFKRSQLLLSLPTDEASQQVASMLMFGEVPGVLLLVDKHSAVQAWLRKFADSVCSVKHHVSFRRV